MFRRREDSLFDNSTDPNQPESMEPASAMNTTPSSNATTSTASTTTPSAAQPAYLQNSPSQPGSAAALRAPEARPATAAQPASSFRPSAPASAPLAGDLNRSRMPESKAPMAPSSSSAGSISGMANFGVKNSGKRVLTVGNDILLKGEIATCDRLVIEGRVDATLNDVHTVEIAETGSFKGSAHIEDAEISGLFEGDLIVRNRLVIYATGKVRGKITYGEIEIERGGEISGEIKTNNASSQTPAARPARQKEEKVAA